MDSGNLEPHSYRLSHNPCPEQNQSIFFTLIHIYLKMHSVPVLPIPLFITVDFPIKILKELIHSPILSSCSSHHNLRHVTILFMLVERMIYEYSDYEVFYLDFKGKIQT
jgi:hypothetical protein